MMANGIMNTSIAESLDDFRKVVFGHQIAKSVLVELEMSLGVISSPQILILTGPTGVGKSTVARAVRNRMLKGYTERMLQEPDIVPIVSVNAVPPNGSSFNWKDFHIRLLTGQSEPLVSRKLYIPPQATLLPDFPVKVHAFQQSTADALRRSVENYLILRETRLLIIDEAQHILLGGNDHRLECQFETLKSLANETGVTILLVGTYRLLDILDQSGQLTRRSQVVNFPRYDKRRKEDRENFKKVLRYLEQKMSVHVSTKLSEDAAYFYRKSAGCVGILKDWLNQCLEYALKENVSQVNAAFADRFALKNRGLLTILEEACWGEEKLADVNDDRLDDLLDNGVLYSREEQYRTGKPRRPGTRNPRRDPVGELRA